MFGIKFERDSNVANLLNSVDSRLQNIAKEMNDQLPAQQQNVYIKHVSFEEALKELISIKNNTKINEK